MYRSRRSRDFLPVPMAQKKKKPAPKKKTASRFREVKTKALRIPEQSLQPTPQPPIPVTGSAEALISQAIAKGADIGTLERLMALRKDVLEEEAKKAFNDAMAAFQEECPVIEKDKGVKTNKGATAYKYAPIDSIVSQVKSLIKKHGFRYTTTMEFNGTIVKVTCRVVHTLGHEEKSVMEVPLGGKTEIMSQTQVVAAASTFAKRYAFLNAFGIMTGDEDNDTASERGDQATNAQAAGIRKEDSPASKPVPQLPRKKERPADGVPYYNPEQDKSGGMTPKQRAFLTTRWGEYMKKCGIMSDVERGTMFGKFVPKIFQDKFQKATSVDQITVQQASFLIDFIPTMPLPERAPAPKEEANKTKPIVMLQEKDILQLIADIQKTKDMPELNDVWNGIQIYKEEGVISTHNSVRLHQAFMNHKVKLNPSPSAR